MAGFSFPSELTAFQPGSLLRGVTEQGLQPVTPPPETIPGGALRERIEEPLQKELPPGVESQFMESPDLLSQLEGMLKESNFTPEQAASLINAIITAPARPSVLGKRAVARGPIGGAPPARRAPARAPARPPVGRPAVIRDVMGSTARRSVVGGIRPPAPSRFGGSIVGGPLPTRALGGAGLFEGLGGLLSKIGKVGTSILVAPQAFLPGLFPGFNPFGKGKYTRI